MNLGIEKYCRQLRKHMASGTSNGHGQTMMGADGWLTRQMGFTGGNNFFPADGGQASGTINSASTPMSYSQPIILLISNSTAVTANVNLWGATVFLDAGTYTWTAGNFVQNNITVSNISTTNALITYRAVQQNTLSSPMTIGKTLVQTISGPDAQTTQIWGINTFASNANTAGQQYPNFQDPTQFRDNVINNFTKYDLDGQTYLTVPVLGSAVFYMAFYPLADINLARPLVGQGTAKTYGPPPGNLAPQPVVIQN